MTTPADFLSQISPTTTYSQLLKVVRPMFERGELELLYFEDCQLATIKHGDNLIDIRSDALDSHRGEFKYTFRQFNGKDYNLTRTTRKRERTKNRGLKEFYDFLNNVSLGVAF